MKNADIQKLAKTIKRKQLIELAARYYIKAAKVVLLDRIRNTKDIQEKEGYKNILNTPLALEDWAQQVMYAEDLEDALYEEIQDIQDIQDQEETWPP